MSTIELHREHTLGLKAARKLAYNWAEKLEQEFDAECTYIEGDDQDEVLFERSGVKGRMVLTASELHMHAKLGMLLGLLKERIEAEIVGHLDTMLDSPAPAKPSTTPAKPKPRAKGR